MTQQNAAEKASQRWYRYGYFFRKTNGVLIPAGKEDSLAPDAYKIGDTKIGGAGRVVDIIKGEAANQLGYDVAVIVDADDKKQG